MMGIFGGSEFEVEFRVENYNKRFGFGEFMIGFNF
jgi:hypothetical protein